MKNLKNFTLAYIKRIFHHRKTSQDAVSYDFSVDGINYVIISTDSLEVKVVPNVNKYSGDIVIPYSVDFRGRQMKVTRISRYAFSHCKNLTSIDLGGVQIIGSRAFEGCTNLKSIDLKEIRVVSKHAFQGCTSLTSIDFGSVEVIERQAFYGCRNIKSLDFTNVVSIGDENFIGCTALTTIDFHNVKNLGKRVFEECTNLSSLTLNTIECLYGEYVLEEAYKKGVFKNCHGLQTVYLDYVKEIHDCAFWGCPNITEIKTKMKEPPIIEPRAFHSYVYLSTLYVPKGCKDSYLEHEVWGKFAIEEYEI